MNAGLAPPRSIDIVIPGSRQALLIADSFQPPPAGRTKVQISVVSVGASGSPETMAPVARSRITSRALVAHGDGGVVAAVLAPGLGQIALQQA